MPDLSLSRLQRRSNENVTICCLRAPRRGRYIEEDPDGRGILEKVKLDHRKGNKAQGHNIK